MSTVLRAVVTYVVLVAFVRLTGKRSLGQMTAFDFVILIVVGQGVQYGLVGPDYSMTNAIVIVSTLLGMHVLVGHIAHRFEPVSRWVDGVPLVVVDHGEFLEERANKSGVTEQDVMESARLMQGVERMDQIKYAVLERSGKIAIIPK